MDGCRSLQSTTHGEREFWALERLLAVARDLLHAWGRGPKAKAACRARETGGWSTSHMGSRSVPRCQPWTWTWTAPHYALYLRRG